MCTYAYVYIYIYFFANIYILYMYCVVSVKRGLPCLMWQVPTINGPHVRLQMPGCHPSANLIEPKVRQIVHGSSTKSQHERWTAGMKDFPCGV